jgi:hypothetical protein
MTYKRKKKLIEPRLQLRFSLAFLSTALVLVMVQAIVIQFVLQRVAARLPHDGNLLQAEIPTVLLISFAVTLLLLAPLSLGIGVMTTFRVVGPLYRFRMFLRQIADGERPGDCRIRQSDELQDFCELLNEATAPLRAAGAASEEPAAPAPEPAERAA